MTEPILNYQLHLYRTLQARLIARFPDTDDQTMHDTLEGITDLHETIAAIVRSALIDEALYAGLKLRLDEMKERLSRLGERIGRKRALALEAMAEVGITKLEQPDFTVSARMGAPALLVTSEEQIPSAYWLPQPSKLDRTSLFHELKLGREVAGAQLSNPQPILTVRTK